MNDLKFTTAGEYIDDIDEYNKNNGRKTAEKIGVTGGETWQTKANKAVPRYYSPVELLSMRVDRLEQELKNLKKELNL
jgi:ubiquinone biosynthesis protein UbiJ|tara:strand:+ start:102 stop:335 length:234 start_codon:yes stop_codon:yes gene_type:complete